MASKDLAGMRLPYGEEDDTFKESDLVSKEPFANFEHWFNVACEADGVIEPNAAALATSSLDGRPSVRMVLLKGFNKDGFTFFTNYNSRKGKELQENPRASLCFYWCNLASETNPWSRQVRIEGRVQKISEEESTAYFHSRPRSSQIGALVSNQSTVIAGRHVLTEKEKELKEKYSDESVPIPKPDFWGGFNLVPDVIEFWQGQTNRIHDRIVFRRPDPDEELVPELTHVGEDGWVYERLSP